MRKWHMCNYCFSYRLKCGYLTQKGLFIFGLSILRGFSVETGEEGDSVKGLSSHNEVVILS